MYVIRSYVQYVMALSYIYLYYVNICSRWSNSNKIVNYQNVPNYIFDYSNSNIVVIIIYQCSTNNSFLFVKVVEI